jgi:hypothetical protein
MPVRRYAQNKTAGYGSFGNFFVGSQSLITSSMKTELLNIKPYLPDTASFSQPAYAWAVTIRWRWKFALISANNSVIRVYNAETGKRQLGTVISKSADYVTSEDFMCYDSQQSELFCSAFVLVGEGGEDDLPCDEPPSSEPITVVEDVLWAAKSSPPNIRFGISALGESAFPYAASGKLADIVEFYPNAGITSFIFGGSYTYSVPYVFFQSEYENEYGFFPAINI